MATIHKRKLVGGEIVWELTHGSGSDRQRIVVGRTQEEAEEMLKQFKRQLGLHGRAPNKDLTIRAAVDTYHDYLQTNRRSRTLRRYVRVLETFAACFMARWHPDVVALRDVRPIHIEEYKQRRAEGEIAPEDRAPEDIAREERLRQELKKNPPRARGPDNAKYGWLGRHPISAKISPRTINYELQTLRTFFSWCVRRNQIFLNPATNVERFRVPKRALPKFLTSAELKKFFAACTDAQRRLFMAILLTGMRKGEVEHLIWSDISFEMGVIFIQEKPDVGWQPKTDERIIPISRMLQQVLVEQWAARKSDKWVFPNEAGNVNTHILQTLKGICKKAGIKQATVHALRHSFGAHLRMAGVNLADIADLLGHKDLATTQIYAKVAQEHLKTAVSRLGKLVHSLPPGRELPPTAQKSALATHSPPGDAPRQTAHSPQSSKED